MNTHKNPETPETPETRVPCDCMLCRQNDQSFVAESLKAVLRLLRAGGVSYEETLIGFITTAYTLVTEGRGQYDRAVLIVPREEGGNLFMHAIATPLVDLKVTSGDKVLVPLDLDNTEAVRIGG